MEAIVRSILVSIFLHGAGRSGRFSYELVALSGNFMPHKEGREASRPFLFPSIFFPT